MHRLHVDRNWPNVTHVIGIGGCIPIESLVSYAAGLVYKVRRPECHTIRKDPLLGNRQQLKYTTDYEIYKILNTLYIMLLSSYHLMLKFITNN